MMRRIGLIARQFCKRTNKSAACPIEILVHESFCRGAVIHQMCPCIDPAISDGFANGIHRVLAIIARSLLLNNSCWLRWRKLCSTNVIVIVKQWWWTDWRISSSFALAISVKGRDKRFIVCYKCAVEMYFSS